MRTRYLGPGWELARVRGTKHNMGAGIRMALDIGARPFGNWSGCHSVGWDISAPPYGDYAVLDNFQKHSYRSEEHTSELQSLMRISYAVFCLKKKKKKKHQRHKIKKEYTKIAIIIHTETR